MKALVVVFGLTMGSVAWAQETALLKMPIADVLGHREAITTLAWELPPDGRHVWGQGFELGLLGRVEFGHTSDLLGANQLNAKVQWFSGERWALSTGIRGFTPGGTTAEHYVVGRYDLEPLRLHAGWMRNDRHRLMLGVDADLGSGRTFLADYISGPDSNVWVGVDLPVGFVNVTLGGGIPRHRTDRVVHSIGITAAFPI